MSGLVAHCDPVTGSRSAVPLIANGGEEWVCVTAPLRFSSFALLPLIFFSPTSPPPLILLRFSLLSNFLHIFSPSLQQLINFSSILSFHIRILPFLSGNLQVPFSLSLSCNMAWLLIYLCQRVVALCFILTTLTLPWERGVAASNGGKRGEVEYRQVQKSTQYTPVEIKIGFGNINQRPDHTYKKWVAR